MAEGARGCQSQLHHFPEQRPRCHSHSSVEAEMVKKELCVNADCLCCQDVMCRTVCMSHL